MRRRHNPMQTDLFADASAPFAKGSTTSKAAALAIEPELSRLCADVLGALIDAGKRGLTCDEVECCLKMRHQTASARINQLSTSGHIVDSGKRRLTRSKRNAVVWLVAVKAAQ